MNLKKKNPKTFWVIVAIVIILFISLIVGLIIGLKPKTTETTTEPTTETTTEPTIVVPEKTLDEKISGIVNLPTVIEKFDDGIIICSNPRNENYKEAILLFLDILNKENIEMLSYSKQNIIVKDGDKIIMDMKEEKDKKEFVISELSRIRKLMKILDERFGKKANYVHFYLIFGDYMNSMLGQPENNIDKTKFIDIFSPIYLFLVIQITFNLYISNKLDWSDEFITYENSKFKVNQLEKMKNDERFKGGEIGYVSSMINDKSLREILEILLQNQPPLEQMPSYKLILNKINYENDDFINTFDSSNACNIASDERFYEKTFKLKKMLQPIREM
jgi:hypothetical protein